MNVRIAQTVSFMAGAWNDGCLEMNQYIVKLWMITQTIDTIDQNIAFHRMKYFFDYELDSIIFVDEADTEKCTELSLCGLNIMTLPGAPADQIIGIMLYHKLNAIMEGRINIAEIEISAGDTVVYLHGEHEMSTDLHQPDWWSNADLVYVDKIDTTENIVSMKSITSWRELKLEWNTSNDVINTIDTGNTIVFADFKSSDDTK
jgi:hypothetical protein